METSFLDVRSDDLRWPQLHETAILYAYSAVERDRDPWCLFTCWRPEFAVEDNWGHVGWVCREQLPSDGQILVAHYRGARGSRTRIEPWIFAHEVDRSFASSMLRRHQQDLALWSDGTSVHVLSRDASRSIGDLRPAAIAHAICESSTDRARFLAFDLPANTWIEALARSACVGAAST